LQAVAEATVGAIHRILLCILLIGLGGLGIELLLLEHDEEATQLIPMVLIGLAFLAVAWHAVRPSEASVRSVQVTMVMFIAAGLLGIYLHYQANVEFQREVDPSIAGRALFWKAMTAKTPPALAPGSMVQLGLIGLAYTFGYPLRQRATTGPASGPGGRQEKIT
jgi:hypothetical protein